MCRQCPRLGVLIIAVAVFGVLATAQDSGGQKRMTPAEIRALTGESGGAGTSGLPAVTTRVLFGDPRQPGLYSIELTVAPDTLIAAHVHRDTRTAVVTGGRWFFGYGVKNEPALLKELTAGAFYTEPAGASHFARTGSEGASVVITGYGPTDTVYGK